MSTHNASISRSARSPLPVVLGLTLLALGPVLSIWWLGSSWASFLPSDARVGAYIGALIVWSPLPISIPALLLQDARDQALPQYGGVLGSLIRGLLLIGHLCSSPTSRVRAEMTASILGFLAACVYVAGLIAF